MDWLTEATQKAKRKNQLLFSKDAECFSQLNLLMSVCNRRVIVLWGLSLAEEVVAELEIRLPGEKRPRIALDAAGKWAAGEITMRPARRAILDCHAAAKEQEDRAAAALLHAVAQGCSVVHTSGHALGLPIYELTAYVCQLGMDGCRETVDTRLSYYVNRLLYWQEQEKNLTRPWAPFLKK